MHGVCQVSPTEEGGESGPGGVGVCLQDALASAGDAAGASPRNRARGLLRSGSHEVASTGARARHAGTPDRHMRRSSDVPPSTTDVARRRCAGPPPSRSDGRRRGRLGRHPAAGADGGRSTRGRRAGPGHRAAKRVGPRAGRSPGGLRTVGLRSGGLGARVGRAGRGVLGPWPGRVLSGGAGAGRGRGRRARGRAGGRRRVPGQWQHDLVHGQSGRARRGTDRRAGVRAGGGPLGGRACRAADAVRAGSGQAGVGRRGGGGQGGQRQPMHRGAHVRRQRPRRPGWGLLRDAATGSVPPDRVSDGRRPRLEHWRVAGGRCPCQWRSAGRSHAPPSSEREALGSR